MNYPPVTDAYTLIRNHLIKIVYPTVVELGVCDGETSRLLLPWCGAVDTKYKNYLGFEPDPRNVARLLNMGIQNKITFTPAAVGNVTGPVTFHLAQPDHNNLPASSSVSAFTPNITKIWPWLREIGTTVVCSYRLDDFCAANHISHIDFLWMDVQGAERLVFSGAQTMLSQIDLIWTEYDDGTHYADSSSLADIKSALPNFELVIDCGGDALFKRR